MRTLTRAGRPLRSPPRRSFNLSLCAPRALALALARADSCKRRKDTPGIAFSGGASPGRTKLPGCHSNWPNGEQSGLLRGICQHDAAVTVQPRPFSRYVFLWLVAKGVRRKPKGMARDPAGVPRRLGRHNVAFLVATLARRKTATIATCRDA
jgi:hypothetical protein